VTGRYGGGDFTDRVEIQQPTLAADGQGGRLTTWETLATVWAQVEPLSGRELLMAQAAQSQVTYRVSMPHRPDVTPAMRLMWRTKTLEILAVLQEAAPAWWLRHS